MSSKLDASIFFRPSGWTGANQREPTTKLMEISVTCISNAVTEPCSLWKVVGSITPKHGFPGHPAKVQGRYQNPAGFSGKIAVS